MILELPEVDVPNWLMNLTAESIASRAFQLQDILRDSLYYPSSGFDGDPVRHLGGNVTSFIYVDYGYTKATLVRERAAAGFRGYELVADRNVTASELVPHGWTPKPPTEHGRPPDQYRAWMKAPFCLWSVFQRQADVPQTHGPARFSLLYLCADGVAAFQALYVANKAHPKVVAIIQTGEGFGMNWTDYRDPDGPLGKSVLENPAGTPDVLLHGGIGDRSSYSEPCWPSCDVKLCVLPKAHRGSITVWSRSTDTARAGSDERRAGVGDDG